MDRHFLRARNTNIRCWGCLTFVQWYQIKTQLADRMLSGQNQKSSRAGHKTTADTANKPVVQSQKQNYRSPGSRPKLKGERTDLWTQNEGGWGYGDRVKLIRAADHSGGKRNAGKEREDRGLNIKKEKDRKYVPKSDDVPDEWCDPNMLDLFDMWERARRKWLERESPFKIKK